MSPNLFKDTIPVVFELTKGQIAQTSSNWLLIKLIKLNTTFLEIEPRLSKKLSPLFTELMSANKPASIEVELIQTVLEHFNTPDDAALLKMAINKLI